MKLVEDHGWTAIANLLPAMGRDFDAQIIVPEKSNVYKCDVVLTYLTDLGALIVPEIAKNLNHEMLNMLSSQIKDDRLREITMNSFRKSTAANVSIVDGRAIADEARKAAEAEKKEDPRAEEPSVQEEPKKEPDTEGESKLEDKQPGEEAVTPLDMHWPGVFKTWLPNPDIEVFEGWIRRILTAEINKRMAEDKTFTTMQLPDTFDEKWMEDLTIAMTEPVSAPYESLVRPARFRDIADKVYAWLKMLAEKTGIFAGTARVLTERRTYGTIAVNVAYMTHTKQE